MTDYECGEIYAKLYSESKYEEASSIIASHYANKDKDYWYYYLIAGAQFRSAMGKRSSELLSKAIENAKKAQKIAPDEEKNDVENLLESIGSGKEIIPLLINWDATQERICKCIEAEDYPEAINVLNRHYVEFENGEFDIDFWNTKFDILTIAHDIFLAPSLCIEVQAYTTILRRCRVKKGLNGGYPKIQLIKNI